MSPDTGTCMLEAKREVTVVVVDNVSIPLSSKRRLLSNLSLHATR